MRRLTAGALMFVLIALLSAARLKDLATVVGVRDNQIYGFGLVVGLAGTGDDAQQLPYTRKALENMLKNMGMKVDLGQLNAKNFAAVVVTATLPPFAKPGDRIDVTVSSIGTAKSLQGGVLLQTPLYGNDGEVYAVAQGPLSLGGFAAGGAGAQKTKNFTTVAKIPGGAIVERGVPMEMVHDGFVFFSLRNPDFTTVKNAVAVVNEKYGPIAEAVDGSTFRVRIPPDWTNNVVGFIGELEQLEVEVDVPAKVVIDEKTGTIVVGGNVKVLPVSIAHGNIEVSVAQGAAVSQPPPFSGGSTVALPQTTTTVKEEKSPFFTVAQVSDVVEALKKIGAKPTDIVAIFRALEAAGALQGRLEVI